MRKRLIGISAAILILLGAMLGFQGFGTGENESDSDEGDGRAVQVSLTSETSDPVRPTTDETSITPASEDPDVLTLLIDDDQYLIQRGDDEQAEFAPSTLEEIVSQARETPGNNVGVRVRLRFKENAQNGAISDLKTALTEGGLDPEAIVEESEFVE